MEIEVGTLRKVCLLGVFFAFKIGIDTIPMITGLIELAYGENWGRVWAGLCQLIRNM